MTSVSTDFPFIRAMPALDCSDMAALAFRKDKLGFDAATWGEPPTFGIMQHDTASIAKATTYQHPDHDTDAWDGAAEQKGNQ